MLLFFFCGVQFDGAGSLEKWGNKKAMRAKHTFIFRVCLANAVGWSAARPVFEESDGNNWDLDSEGFTLCAATFSLSSLSKTSSGVNNREGSRCESIDVMRHDPHDVLAITCYMNIWYFVSISFR